MRRRSGDREPAAHAQRGGARGHRGTRRRRNRSEAAGVGRVVAVADRLLRPDPAGRRDRQALDGWFRDELRIESVHRGALPAAAETRRAERIATWINDLRQRANLAAK